VHSRLLGDLGIGISRNEVDIQAPPTLPSARTSSSLLPVSVLGRKSSSGKPEKKDKQKRKKKNGQDDVARLFDTIIKCD